MRIYRNKCDLSGNLSSNSSLGAFFALLKIFWAFADSKSSLAPKKFYKYKSHTANTSIVIRVANQGAIFSSLRGSLSEAKTTKQSIPNRHTERSEVSKTRESKSQIRTMPQKRINETYKNLDSLDSFSQKGCTPRPAPPTRQKLTLFAFRGRASLNPLLAKNRRLHFCNLAPDFLHHEAGEIKGASHELFLLDSANAESNPTTKDTL